MAKMPITVRDAEREMKNEELKMRNKKV